MRDWKSSGRFSPAERAVLAAADDTCERGAISDAAWAQCEQALRDPAILIEMVVAIGNWTLFSQLLQSLRVPLEPDVMPWPPDGKAPPAAN